MKASDKRATKDWLYKKYKGKCFYCPLQLKKDDATIDHWIPKEKGGTNIRSNLRLACKSCNQKKANKMPYLYAAERN